MPEIGGATRLAAVIGSPVRHSLSPAIHNAAFAAVGIDWRFVALEVAPGDCARALDGMRSLGLAGLSVTTPHKDDVAALVDERSDDAEALAAVNCVVPLPGGRLRGENTDGPGFVAALVDAGCAPVDRTCVVVGAGGAARSVVLALARAGAAEVVVVNRTPAKAAAAVALAGPAGRIGAADDIRGADLVVNATSVGMADNGGVPFDPRLLRGDQVVAELIVHPVRTPLLAAAADAGCTTVDGIGMLVHQAAIAFERWTGFSAPVEAMQAAARLRDA
jgi:shikimate dehydrogenase